MGGRGSVRAAGAGMTKLLQLSFPTPLLGSVGTGLWGAIVAVHLGIITKVSVLSCLRWVVVHLATLKIQRFYSVRLGTLDFSRGIIYALECEFSLGK